MKNNSEDVRSNLLLFFFGRVQQIISSKEDTHIFTRTTAGQKRTSTPAAEKAFSMEMT